MTTSIAKLEMLANAAVSPTHTATTTPTPIPTPAPTPTQEESTEHESASNAKTNPTITLFDTPFDVDTIVVGIIVAVVWVITWRSVGLMTIVRRDSIFLFIFSIFFVYLLMNVASAGITSGGTVYELNVLLTVEQMISILFGSIIVFSLFSSNLQVHDNCKSVISKITMSAIIILSISSLWVNVITSGRAFRAIRKLKQGMYNIALSLFIIIGLIYIKGGECRF